MKTFYKCPNVMFSHDNRVIVDNEVYELNELGEFQLTFVLENDEMLGGVGLTKSILLVSHVSYGKVTLYQWNHSHYVELQRAKWSNH